MVDPKTEAFVSPDSTREDRSEPIDRPVAVANPVVRRWAMRAYLLLDLGVRVTLWGGAFALTTFVFHKLDAWPEESLVGADLSVTIRWAQRLACWIVLFNVAYVAGLLFLRLLIPTPKEGEGAIGGRFPAPKLVWTLVLSTLTKARYAAPFPAFLVYHVASLPPMCWLMGPIFGPRSDSIFAVDPKILDPSYVRLGSNVALGFNCSISGHYQVRDRAVLKRTLIEDNVVVGGHAVVLGGVHVRSGSVVGAGAVVLPNTVIGPNEFWAGVPAKKVRDLPPIAGASGCQ